MIDMHTHILFGVDDGAKDIEESLELIRLEINQGVTDIVLTPHIQSKASKTSRETHVMHFNKLNAIVKEMKLPINLHLGAEINYKPYVDLDYQSLMFGKGNYILVEFSRRLKTNIEEVCYDLMHMGYQVIVAHIERYQYLSINDIKKIKATGALIQVNADAILNLDRLASKKTVKQLIKLGLFDIISSDTHNLSRRPPRLLEAKNYLKKYLDEGQLNLVFNRLKL